VPEPIRQTVLGRRQSLLVRLKQALIDGAASTRQVVGVMQDSRGADFVAAKDANQRSEKQADESKHGQEL
jgi:hypothetical protein